MRISWRRVAMSAALFSDIWEPSTVIFFRVWSSVQRVSMRLFTDKGPGSGRSARLTISPSHNLSMLIWRDLQIFESDPTFEFMIPRCMMLANVLFGIPIDFVNVTMLSYLEMIRSFSFCSMVILFLLTEHVGDRFIIEF